MAADASPKFHPPDLLELSLPPSPPHDGLHFYQFMAAGSVAGVVEHTAMFPVDTLKTLIQAYSLPCHPPLTIRQTLRSVSSPLSLYRGISAMALGAAPAHAFYFSVYEFSKKFLSERNPNPNLNPVVHAFSGVLATVSSDAVFTPMDTVKQRLQLHSSPYKGVMDCVRRVLKEEGLGALYRSYRTTVVMNAPFTAVHFSTYEAVKRGLMEISSEEITDEGRLVVHATAGAAAGALAAAVTTPLDVAKTQLQCQGVCGCAKFSSSSMREVIQAIIKRDGYVGLMRGWGPRHQKPTINTNTQHQAQPHSPLPAPPPSSPPKPSAADAVNPSEPPPAAAAAPASPDDASSLNRLNQEEDGMTFKINLRSISKDKIYELKKKLAGELEQVREFARKMESLYGGSECTQSQHSAAPAMTGAVEGFDGEDRLLPNYHQLSVSVVPEHNGNGVIDMKDFDEEAPTPNYPQLNGYGNSVIRGFDKEERTPKYRQLNVSVAPDSNGIMIEGFERQKRMPKANKLYLNSDFILIGKDKFLPPELNGCSNKKLKPNTYTNSFLDKKYAHVFKKCAALLAKLMKHKFGWVFNVPVDVKGLGLHDYYTIIKHPMDLGTVKLRLNKNWYKSPGEFAEDVRLTFRNAMTYNPKGQDVHVMAHQLSQIFEQRWPSIEAEYAYVHPMQTPVAKRPSLIDARMLERLDSRVHPMSLEMKMNQESYPPPAPAPITRPLVLRQPKPKAKDLYKRTMTIEEKQKLSGHLQNLPPEKLDGVVQIIRKRNAALCPQDDEIEIEIDCVDTETLWELDRFVTNYKKSLSKYKRKAELATLAKADAERERGQERITELEVVGEPRENDTASLMDRREANSSFPGGVENNREHASRSNSSSSSSSESGSSSRDSDSDSSSASDAGD